MCELGNGVINQIYEARREELGARKPQPGDPRYTVDKKCILFILFYFILLSDQKICTFFC